MDEKELIGQISNFYGKFFVSDKKSQVQCYSKNELKIKILKIGLKLLNYGICDNCSKINFFKEVKEYQQGNYQQVWKHIPIPEIKEEFEKQLEIPINEEDLEYYSPNFVQILTKLDKLLNELIQAKSKIEAIN